jgi:hypothetical protein
LLQGFKAGNDFIDDIVGSVHPQEFIRLFRVQPEGFFVGLRQIKMRQNQLNILIVLACVLFRGVAVPNNRAKKADLCSLAQH